MRMRGVPVAQEALVDIGVNLLDPAFDADREAVIARAQEAGVIWQVLTGTQLKCSEQSVALAQQYPQQLRATAGVHPHHASTWQPDWQQTLAALLADPFCVAVGETGLDYNRLFSPESAQLLAFEAQLELAAEMQKPLFLHERDAAQPMLERLHHWRDDLAGGVLHCFTGDKKALFGYLDLDLYIGITGWICDERRGQELASLVRSIPADRLLIETDAPWLLPRTIKPKPKRGRNEPAFLPWVVEKLAAERGESPARVAAITTANACRLFALPLAESTDPSGEPL